LSGDTIQTSNCAFPLVQIILQLGGCMTGKTTEFWMEFCQLAANRAAPGKLIALASEI